MRIAGALALLALAAPAARAAVDGPITPLAAVGGRPSVLARADGSAIAVWEEKPTATTANVHFCRIAANAGTCTAGSEKILTGAAGSTTSKPFVFDLSANRIVVVHGGCCPQRTLRFISSDGGATFGASADFASLVPVDQGATAGPGDTISIVGDPATGTVGYQRADPAAAKTTQEVTLDTQGGLTSGQAVAVDPSGRPYAAWASSDDGFAAGSIGPNFNVAGGWTLPATTLAGTVGIRLAGPFAVWIQDGRHQVARWTGSAFGAGTPLPFTAADAGESDIAVDPAGGVHVVFTPLASGNVCYAYAPDGTTFGVPRLLGRDTAGVSGLDISATGAGQGRIVFGALAAAGPVSIVALSAPGLTPNACGVPPSGLALAKTITGSTVRASVDPAGQDATFHVEYGTSTSYGSSTPEATAPAAGGPAVTTFDLGALAPATTYHARIVAGNASGTATGPDVAFTTPAILRAVRARDLIRLPARCRNRRLRVGLPAPKGVARTLAVLRATGRRPLRLGRRRLQARSVLLTGLARGAVRVRVAVRLTDGRVLRASRAYRGCGRGMAR